jgi:DNA-3-methyladenine glycosylase
MYKECAMLTSRYGALPPPVDRKFFDQPTLALAPSLLGLLLVHASDEGLTVGRVVEVEAYIGPHDRAAHSYGGRRTPRTAVMYEEPGLTYVYRSYGLHVCFDVVSGPPGAPEAILVRALDPVLGIPLMRRRRGVGADDETTSARRLAGGPGRLTAALGITMAANGHPLWLPPLYLADDGWRPPAASIRSGPRIGIDGAGEARTYPWRFWIAGHPALSRPDRPRRPDPA